MNRYFTNNAVGELHKSHGARDHGVVYKCDGTGRDTYIMFNNGGNCQPKYFPASPSPGLPHLNKY